MKTIKYFSASWCVPCKQFKPIMKQLQSEGVNIQFIDVEWQPKEAKQYNVRSMPTCVIVKNGQEVNRFSGVKSKNQVKQIYQNS